MSAVHDATITLNIAESCNWRCCGCTGLHDEDFVYINNRYQIKRLKRSHPDLRKLNEQTHTFLRYYASRQLQWDEDQMDDFYRRMRENYSIDLKDENTLMTYHEFKTVQRTIASVKIREELNGRHLITRSGHVYKR